MIEIHSIQMLCCALVVSIVILFQCCHTSSEEYLPVLSSEQYNEATFQTE